MAVYRCNMGIKNSQATEDGLKARALWIAVIMRAIKDKVQIGADTAGVNQAELSRWFASNSKDECSFEWMCSACRLPASKIRRAIEDGSAERLLSKSNHSM